MRREGTFYLTVQSASVKNMGLWFPTGHLYLSRVGDNYLDKTSVRYSKFRKGGLRGGRRDRFIRQWQRTSLTWKTEHAQTHTPFLQFSCSRLRLLPDKAWTRTLLRSLRNFHRQEAIAVALEQRDGCV